MLHDSRFQVFLPMLRPTQQRGHMVQSSGALRPRPEQNPQPQSAFPRRPGDHDGEDTHLDHHNGAQDGERKDGGFNPTSKRR